MTKRGAMLGDVVGLGKTLTAIAVALMLRDEHGFQPLVVCPKNLQKMWEDHLEEYDLHGRVVPYSMATKTLPELRRYPFVIADESHTLRNNQRQDYLALRDYILRNDCRVLLLTATPFNIRFQDVANQLALYVDDDDLGIAPVAAIGKDPALPDKVDSKITTLQAFRRSEEPDDWKRLMSQHLVRRTRSFIQSNYSKLDPDGRAYLEFADGRQFTFPRRIALPLQHSFGNDDPAAKMADDRTLDTINSLLLPRYDLHQYLLRTVHLTVDERAFADGVAQGRGHVAGFVRTTSFKRLSSGGHSFVLSVQRHIARNELWLHAIANNIPVPTGDIQVLSLGDDGDDVNSEDATPPSAGSAQVRYDALRAANPGGVRWVRSSLFSRRLAEALTHDTTSLRDLLNWYGPWEARSDSKLQALIGLLRGKHGGDKVLIFTEYKDTADYLGMQLQDAGIVGVGTVTGESEDPTAVAAQFSPASNGKSGANALAKHGELRVLIATDVLSEGQNLQDSHVIVNFDLPWAIIRLIQRAGRVDRIRQTSAEVLLYSFFHESVDNVISLRQRIADRLAANAQAFGSDETFFGSADETQIIADLYSGELDDSAPDDEVDASSLAYQYWTQAVADDPALERRISHMPDMVGATRARRLGEQEDGVGCYVRTAGGIDAFAFSSPNGQVSHLTGHEAIARFKADKYEPGLPLRDDHDGIVRQIITADLTAAASSSGRLRGVRKRVWARLGATLSWHTDQEHETRIALDELFQRPLTQIADTRLKRAIRNGVADADLAALVRALHNDGSLVIPSRTGKDPLRIITTMGVNA
ncbi:MAG: DEAD/DEAH box helicase [Bifidobacteriaceae bacterium]|jgi:superfamily II DNA or RNA helicase|nr:DEAD/DEAH box helicase [Bifidobacteriaceae bacterium]